ncbi:MAG: sulfatase-like hydrolase/transferase [Acidobacteriia bacterium]|nr:sulfatase-like hydrolase/transferase [Terriglobia bacterium]
MPVSNAVSPSRRDLLAAVPAAVSASSAALAQTGGNPARPNIVIVISDQFRWDLVGAMGLNPMNLTPNLDAIAGQGVMFRNAVSAQPVCAPARGSIFTGQYPSRHGVWRNGLGLAEGANTLATSLRQSGYSANYIGKWHLSAQRTPDVPGPVPPERRGGFLDLWQASNVLEHTSHAYEGDLFDNDGKPIHFSGQYRVDFMTGLATRFLRAAKQPFLLCVSYLEVHHQNDTDTYDPPKEYARRFVNPFVPEDLRPLPGSWPSQWSDYLGCVARMDDAVGTIRRTLAETGLAKNTILAFLSDHGCHFKTRNTEYKRSPHESSIHVPLIVEGPGFNRGIQIPEVVSHVDLAPTLLTAAGVAAPSSMQGRNFLPLLDRRVDGWRNEAYFELAEFITGRGLRTPQYTYCAAAPKAPGWRSTNGAEKYTEYAMYDLFADPHQRVNLAGRTPYRSVSEELRKKLIARIEEANGARSTIEPAWFPYS